MKKRIVCLFLVMGVVLSQGVVINAAEYFISETEINDSIEQANPVLALKDDLTTVNGTVSSTDNRDVFMIRSFASGSGAMCFRFDFDKLQTGANIEVQFRDSSNNLLQINNDVQGEFLFFKDDMKFGDYTYVIINRNGSTSDVPYKLSCFMF